MSRYAVDPRWLVHLPPTMAPGGTVPDDADAAGDRAAHLEHPREAFAAYRHDGVASVVCEEKHMGSRAVVVLVRDAAAAARRFGVPSGGPGGVCVTRTGRPFLDEDGTGAFLDRVRRAVTAAGLWEELGTDWLVLDAELLPWSAKAQGLITGQYASGGRECPCRARRGRHGSCGGPRRESRSGHRTTGRLPTGGPPEAEAGQEGAGSVVRSTARPSTTCSSGGGRAPTSSTGTRPRTAGTRHRPRPPRSCAWRRSTCSPVRDTCTSTGRTAGTSRCSHG